MKYVRITALSIIATIALASCGGDDSSKPAAAKAPASPNAAESAEPAADSGGYGGGKSKGSARLELQEGITTQSDADYTTANFVPRATFHTPNLAYPFFTEIDSPRGLFFNTQAGGLIFLHPAKIFDPATGKLAAVPGDLTSWATANDHLDAAPVEPATVAGLHGSQVTATVTSTIAKVGDCERSCIRLAPTSPNDSMWFVKGDHFRLISVQVHGEAVGIVLVSDKSGFGQLASAATKLLKTLEFH